jgi:hypothetical protein
MLADQFCKDFSFRIKYPELKAVLHTIKEFLFPDNGERKSDLVVCENHGQYPQYNLHLNFEKRPIECYKIEKDLEIPDDL